MRIVPRRRRVTPLLALKPDGASRPGSGDPTPSRADIQMTKAIVDIATPLGIAVHDHIIVGKNGQASLKALKLIA